MGIYYLLVTSACSKRRLSLTVAVTSVDASRLSLPLNSSVAKESLLSAAKRSSDLDLSSATGSSGKTWRERELTPTPVVDSSTPLPPAVCSGRTSEECSPTKKPVVLPPSPLSASSTVSHTLMTRRREWSALTLSRSSE